MADLETETKKKAEQATVLLSLAAIDKEAQGPCLTPQEMAELIEDRCDKDTLETFWQHLGSCNRCYSEWLFLKRYQGPVKKRGQIYRLSWSKKLGVVGSALAAAASVAVYLNIPHHQERFVEDAMIIQQTSPQVSKSLEPSLPTEEKTEVPAMLSAPVAIDSAVKKQKQCEMEEEIDMEQLKEIIEQQALPAAPTAVQMKSTRMVGEMGASAKRDKDTGNINHCLMEIRENCLSGQQSPSFWLSARGKGERILELQSPTLSPKKQKKIITVLQLLAPINNEESAMTQCQLIISELAEDDQSR